MKLKKEDFPLEFKGITIDYENNRLLIVQNNRLKKEYIRIPIHNNGWFEFVDSNGEEFFVYSGGAREELKRGRKKIPWGSINEYIEIIESLARPDLED